MLLVNIMKAEQVISSPLYDMPNEDEDVEEEKSLLDPDLRVENGYVLAFKEGEPPKLPPRVPSTPPELPRQPQISDDLKERILEDIDSIDNPRLFSAAVVYDTALTKLPESGVQRSKTNLNAFIGTLKPNYNKIIILKTF